MSTSNKICNDGAPKSNYDGVCEVSVMLQCMKTADVETNKCANCGKEGSAVTNSCNTCNLVMYCNAACKKKHRSKHKKKCDRHVAELLDEKLFKQPPKLEDCPICFLQLPMVSTGRTYQACCGKIICSGCWYANANIDLDKQLCALCRTPAPDSDEEIVERTKKRVEVGDADAIFSLGNYYADGENGLPKDYPKALELYKQAGELGSIRAYFNIGTAHYIGKNGVEMDKQKGDRYFELAAMRGNAIARHNLGCTELEAGNKSRALKHWMIALGGGHSKCLNNIQLLYSLGQVTKDEYTKALRARQEYLGEIKSEQRDEAAAIDGDKYKYY